MSDAVSEWQRAMDLSKEMQQLATTQQWEELAALSSRRQGFVSRQFEKGSVHLDVQSLRTEIEEMISNDRVILALAEREQKNTTARLRKIEKGKRALRAYRMS